MTDGGWTEVRCHATLSLRLRKYFSDGGACMQARRRDYAGVSLPCRLQYLHLHFRVV